MRNNPHICELIEIRKVEDTKTTLNRQELHDGPSLVMEKDESPADPSIVRESSVDVSQTEADDLEGFPSSSSKSPLGVDKTYHGPSILLGVVKDGEKFDFCMSNPPFFATMEVAGLNPKTSCGGTPEEMVCPGGEQAFISRIIEDSVTLKQSFRYSFS